MVSHRTAVHPMTGITCPFRSQVTSAPAKPRTGQELYSVEFLRALNSTPGGEHPLDKGDSGYMPILFQPTIYHALPPLSFITPLPSTGSGAITGPAALAAAIQAWAAADNLVKQRYLEKETAEKQRYEKELQAWLDKAEDVKVVETARVLDLKKVGMVTLCTGTFSKV